MKVEELFLRQNPFETEVREQITDGQTFQSDQAASHESVLQQLRQGNDSRDRDSEAERNEPQSESSQSSTSLIILKLISNQ